MNVSLLYFILVFNSFTDDSNNNRKCYSEIDIEMNQQISKVIISLQKDLEKVVKSVNLIEQRIGQLQGKVCHFFVTMMYNVSIIIMF